MKKQTLKYLGSLLCSISITLFVQPNPLFARGAVNAVEIAQRLDKTKYTSDQIKGYVRKLNKKTKVVATGTVRDVKSGRSGTKVVLHVTVPGRKRKFLVAVMVNNAQNIRRGQSATCSGKYLRYSRFDLNGVTIEGSCR